MSTVTYLLLPIAILGAILYRWRLHSVHRQRLAVALLAGASLAVAAVLLPLPTNLVSLYESWWWPGILRGLFVGSPIAASLLVVPWWSAGPRVLLALASLTACVYVMLRVTVNDLPAIDLWVALYSFSSAAVSFILGYAFGALVFTQRRTDAG